MNETSDATMVEEMPAAFVAPDEAPATVPARLGRALLTPAGGALATFLAAMLITGLVVLLVPLHPRADETSPGVRVLNTPVGDQPSARVREVIQQSLPNLAGDGLILTYQDQSWQVPAPDLGLQLDLDRTVSEALGAGREDGIMDFLGRRAGLLHGYRDVPVTVEVDGEALRARLRALAQSIDVAPVEPDLALTGSAVTVTPGQPGRALDVEATAESIRQRLADASTDPVALTVVPREPTASEAQLQEQAETLRRLLSAPLTLRGADRTWELSPEQLAGLIEIVREPAGPEGEKVVARLSEDRLTRLLGGLAKDINQQARDARFDWAGGALRPLVQSQDGRTLDVAASVAAIRDRALAPERSIALVVKTTPATVATSQVQNLGIRELVSSGQSSFRGSTPERAANIATAARHLNGAVIPPGATFSFNDAIGDITPERGYREGLTIVADQTVPGIGGGVCQVSTTTFRAAFWSGVPITERNPHAYRVSWYEQMGEPVGFDAAIYQPGADLKFVNSTQAHLLVQASVADAVLTVSLYGTKPPWEVKLDGPVISNRIPAPATVQKVDPSLAPGTRKQVEWATDGLDVTLYRTVTQDGQQLRRDAIFSRFAAWGSVFLVGPGAGA